MSKTAHTQRTIPLDRIHANVDQPRKIFDKRELESLAASILENGLAQPITVRPVDADDEGQRFEIVMGERRFRAHQLLVTQGHESFAFIRANVRDMDEMTRDIQAILENLQRVDVSPIEESRAFQRLLDTGMSKDDLAKKLGRQVWRIEERTRLLNLEPSLLHLYESRNLSQEGASELSRLPDHYSQMKIAKLIMKGTVTGYKAIRACVDAALDMKSQADIFGDAAPRVSDEDVELVKGMEAKIERMATLAAAGWKDGECVIATKVSRDRARLMADKMKAMQSALYAMERELRVAAAQAEAVLCDAA